MCLLPQSPSLPPPILCTRYQLRERREDLSRLLSSVQQPGRKSFLRMGAPGPGTARPSHFAHGFEKRWDDAGFPIFPAPRGASRSLALSDLQRGEKEREREREREREGERKRERKGERKGERDNRAQRLTPVVLEKKEYIFGSRLLLENLFLPPAPLNQRVSSSSTSRKGSADALAPLSLSHNAVC